MLPDSVEMWVTQTSRGGPPGVGVRRHMRWRVSSPAGLGRSHRPTSVTSVLRTRITLPYRAPLWHFAPVGSNWLWYGSRASRSRTYWFSQTSLSVTANGVRPRIDVARAPTTSKPPLLQALPHRLNWRYVCRP